MLSVWYEPHGMPVLDMENKIMKAGKTISLIMVWFFGLFASIGQADVDRSLDWQISLPSIHPQTQLTTEQKEDLEAIKMDTKRTQEKTAEFRRKTNAILKYRNARRGTK
jgi:hypothetical protein